MRTLALPNASAGRHAWTWTLLFLLIGCGDAALEEQAAATCEAVALEHFDEALALSVSGASPIGAGREIAECRCIALLSIGDRDTCTALLDPLLADARATDWIPHAVLAKLMVRTWQAEGRISEAAGLASRVARVHRDDLDLLQLELMLRSSLEDETQLLAEIEHRLEDDPSWTAQRLVLALGWSRRARYDAALRVLGETPPAIDHPLALPWHESRIQAQTAAGDLAAVQASFAAWRAAGWDPIDLDARYALRLSVGQLIDPRRDTVDLLREAIATQDQLRDRNIVWGLHRRLITELLAKGLPEFALAAYDEAVRVVPIERIRREEIEREVRRAAGGPTPDEPARLRFRLPGTLPAGRLALSPGSEAPPDAGYTVHPVDAQTPLELTMPVGPHARRWVLRDGTGAVRASGAFWPEAGATIEIEPTLRPAAGVKTSPRPTRLAADGRRRVFAILPDCGDWRLVEYLREHGDLPFQDHLFSKGYRAVLESRPAFTAAALQSLVWPAPAHGRSGLGWIHDLGLELAGLESIGRNPLGFLSWVLPERPNLFETLGAGSLVTANMLLAHGRIEAGRHAELIGPHGSHRSLPSQNAYRALRPDELARHPSLHADPNTKKFAETIAAEMDAAEQIAREGEVDFLFLRLEALDLLTHAHFAALDGRGQDDAQGPLLTAYRYIDERLAALDGLLDEDDWLVYLSDHGIRSSMQHEEDAIFVVVGEGVPHGRARGTPPLRGVPRSLAAMLAIETHWPETDMTPWLRVDQDDAEVASRR